MECMEVLKQANVCFSKARDVLISLTEKLEIFFLQNPMSVFCSSFRCLHVLSCLSFSVRILLLYLKSIQISSHISVYFRTVVHVVLVWLFIFLLFFNDEINQSVFKFLNRYLFLSFCTYQLYWNSYVRSKPGMCIS